MSGIAPFHPEWLISFWMGTPFLNKLNPHIVLLILLIGVIILVILKRKQKMKEMPDSDEKRFQMLLKKKSIIEEKIAQLESQWKNGERTDEQYEKISNEYKQHLEGVKKDLLRFT